MIMIKCDWTHDYYDRMPDDDTGEELIMMKAFLLLRYHQDDGGTFLQKTLHHFDATASICISRQEDGAIKDYGFAVRPEENRRK